MTRSTTWVRPTAAQERLLADDLSALPADDLWVCCNNLCEIADEGVATGSLDHAAAVAYQLPIILTELRSRQAR
jgi:hypothetical protein